MKQIKGLKFQPWIGSNYENSKYGKLLLLGESHYLGEEEVADDFTTAVLNNYLNKEEMKTPFFNKIELLFSNEQSDFWNNIAFANLIQNGLIDSKSQPMPNDLSTITHAFKLLLDNLKPDKVIVLSKRMWNNWLPEENGNYKTDISINGKHSTVWEYHYQTGKCLAMGIVHPSRMFGNSYKNWQPIVKKFLSMKIKI